MYGLVYDGSNNAVVKLQEVPPVGRIRAVGRVLVSADSWMEIIVVVQRLRYVDLVPGMDDSNQNYSNRAVTVFTVETQQNQSKLIISFDRGLQL